MSRVQTGHSPVHVDHCRSARNFFFSLSTSFTAGKSAKLLGQFRKGAI